MLLHITTTHQPATDLGYLLHKHPDKCQSFSVTGGTAYIFYPEATVEKCTATLLLDIDPVELVRGKGDIEHYINDRPYVASSFLSVAIAKVFRTALSGRCQDLPQLVRQPIPLTANLPTLPCRGGVEFFRNLFEPLGYQVEAETLELDSKFPDWGDSVYINATIHQTVRLSDLLSHIYVMIPVLDEYKHYWIGKEEIAKLLSHGEGWLSNHPYKDEITQRYFKRYRKLAKIALKQLQEEDPEAIEATDINADLKEIAIEKPLTLNQQRLQSVAEILRNHQVTRVIDFGCGEGTLLKYLLKNQSIEQITGVDVAYSALEIAKDRLKLDNLPFHHQDKIKLIPGSLIYRDPRFCGYDAATLIEVIEHLDLNRLEALERVLFEFSQPRLVIITTPNVEYNINFPTLTNGKLRHSDHRFEWTRQEFHNWANQIASQYKYQVKFKGIGPQDPQFGPPTQMSIFQSTEV